MNSLGFCLGHKHTDQKWMGIKGFICYTPTGHSPTMKETKTEPTARNSIRDHRRMLLTGLLPGLYLPTCLKLPSTNCLGAAPYTMLWIIHQQSTIKKMPYENIDRPMWRRCSLSWSALFSGDLALCLVDKILTNTLLNNIC